MRAKKQNWGASLPLAASLLVPLVGCEPDITPAVDLMVDHYLEHGITCDGSDMMSDLSVEEQDKVIDILVSDLGSAGVMELLELGGGCGEAYDVNEAEEFDPTALQMSEARHIGNDGQHTVRTVPERSFSGGTRPSAIYRDGSSADWMCSATGGAESPADFIILTHLSGAWASPDRVEVRGRNMATRTAIPGGLGSRIYQDNHVASCLGFWRTVFLMGWPFTSDFRFQVD